MHRSPTTHRRLRPGLLALSAVAGLLIATPSALAQRGGPGAGGPGAAGARGPARGAVMTPERAEVAWTWQVRELAHVYGLSDEQLAALTKTYVAVRKEQAEASRAAMREALRRRADRGGVGGAGGAGGAGEGGRGGGGGNAGARGGAGRGNAGARGGAGGAGGDAAGDRPQREDPRAAVDAKMRAKIRETAATMLEDEPLKQAMMALGAFNVQWDRMVDGAVQLKLEEKAMLGALAPMRTYAVSVRKIRESGDRRAMRQGLADARATLERDLAKVLDEAQMGSLRRTFGGARGGRGARGDRDGSNADRPERRGGPGATGTGGGRGGGGAGGTGTGNGGG